MVIFPICNFNSSYTTFFPFIWSISVSVYDAFVFRRARQLTNISAEQERFACQCDRQCRLCACIQHWCMPNFYSMINARFNERRTDANRGDILSSHDKNRIHVRNHARVHTVSSYVSVIIESFCVINMPKRLKFFESLDPSMTKPYRLVFNTNVISEGSGEPVLLCNLVG